MLLLIVILLAAAAGFVWYWYPEKRNSFESLWGAKVEDRGYLNYEEHLAKEEREKSFSDFKKKISGWFESKK